jgi:hypothetical protein
MEKLIIVLIIMVFAVAAAAPVIARNCSAITMPRKNWHGLENEIAVIQKAADRNFCKGKLFSILLAIRKAENGPAGFEFGVVAVKDTNFEKQAAWAAATIVKNYTRFRDAIGLSGELKEWWAEDFIEFLACRYCPPSADLDGHQNWLKNVKFWYKKFEE